jgi:UDP-glucose 4-epimerase
MSRILVTGASGFIGRAVIAAFKQGEDTLRAAVRRPPLPPFPQNIEVTQLADLATPIDWKPLLYGIDKVIHLAGIAQIGRGVAPELYDLINRAGTAQLATAAAQAGINHFVFVSSIRAQCGPVTDRVLTERDPATPIDSYGRSKLAAEAAVRSSGVPFTILRPVMLYGPGVKGNLALLLRAARSRLPLPVKDFANRRSLLGIENFVSALTFVLSAPTAIGETYIVADPGIPPPLANLIATLREAQGRRPLTISVPTHYFEIPLRMMGRGDLWDRVGGNFQVDPGKLIAAGWRPSHDTRGGLAALIHAAMRTTSRAIV